MCPRAGALGGTAAPRLAWGTEQGRAQSPSEMPGAGGSRRVWPLLALSPRLERGQEWGCSPWLLQSAEMPPPHPHPCLVGRQIRTRQGCHCTGRGLSHPRLCQGASATNAGAHSGSGLCALKPGLGRNPSVQRQRDR